jgi:hypothetical protein
MHLKHSMLLVLAVIASTTCGAYGSRIPRSAPEGEWDDGLHWFMSHNDSLVEEGLENQQHWRGRYSILPFEPSKERLAGTSLQRVHEVSVKKHPSAWESLYASLKEEDALDVTLEATALVMFSLVANILLFASCHLYPSGSAAKNPHVQQNHSNPPDNLHRMRQIQDSSVDEGEEIRIYQEGRPNQQQQQQRHRDQPKQQKTTDSLNQADRVIMKFMYGMCIPEAAERDRVGSAHSLPKNLSVVGSTRSLAAPAPAFGHNLQNDLDRQSMLMASASVHGFFLADKRTRHA